MYSFSHPQRLRYAVVYFAATLFGVPLTLVTQSQTVPPSAKKASPTQTESSPNAPLSAAITVNARLVVLDVVAKDQNGKPIDGLTAGDFEVFEDGQLQKIRSLEPPSAHGLPQPSAGQSVATVFDPAQPASFGNSPVNILVLDQLNTHFADSSFARRSLHDYLAAEPAVLPQPTTLLNLYDGGFKSVAGFTRDREALLRALAATPTEYAWKLEVNGKTDHGPIERLDQSLRALEAIAQSNARIPGHKNLIWIGGGFPTIDPAAIDGDDLQDVKDTLQHVTNVLLDTRVTLYAVDPASSAMGMTEVTDASQMAFVQATGDSFSGTADPFNSAEDFDHLGPVTGGRVIRGKNDVAHQIAASVDLGSSFYTISYSPTSSSEATAQYRKIRVVCLRPGVTISTRSGYYSGKIPREKFLADAAYDLSTAAESETPFKGLSVTVERDSQPGAPTDSYIVHVGASGLTWGPNADGSATASVYILAASLNAKNKMQDHVLQGMKAQAKPGVDLHDPAMTADFYFRAQPAPRSVTLRFIVRDSETGRMGSVDVPLARR